MHLLFYCKKCLSNLRCYKALQPEMDFWNDHVNIGTLSGRFGRNVGHTISCLSDKCSFVYTNRYIKMFSLDKQAFVCLYCADTMVLI